MLAADDVIPLEPADWSDAIALTDGPQSVIAGPGTGKTEFLARRCAHLVNVLGVAPSEVVALTFSRRAAQRLRRRVAVHAPGRVVPASTFHSLAYRLLEAYGPAHLAWERMPTLLTSVEHVGLVRDLLAGETASDWAPHLRDMLGSQTLAREVSDFLMRSQEYMIDEDALRDRAAARGDWRGLAAFRRRYRDELERQGRIDYGTLQAEAVRLLALPGVAAALADQIRYVVIDEYQDTTPAQAAFVQALAAAGGNVVVAGDPNQSIYGFRGADPDNLVEFERDFSDLGPITRFALARSFRCPPEILQTAQRLAPHSIDTTPARHRGSVEAYVFSQQSEESEWIAAEVQRLILSESVPASSIAVLVRSKRRLLTELSRAMARRRIPHNMPDSRLVDHPGVRLVFDLVAAAVNDRAPAASGIGAETDQAIRRLLLGPLYSLPLGAERHALRRRRAEGAQWSALVEDVVPDGAGLAGILSDSRWATHMTAADGFWYLWTSLPRFAQLVERPDDGGVRRALASLSQALGRLAERDPQRSLFDYWALVDRDDFEADPLISLDEPEVERVTLTTLHQAKGLEFDTVFVADATEGVFPDLRRHRSLLQPHLLSHRPDLDHDVVQLHEELRLAYTALTRSSRRSVWTTTQAGIDQSDRRPSRFLPLLADGRDLGAPGQDPEAIPLTYLEAEAHLRRLATDASAAAANRLAAVDRLVARPNPGLRPVESFTGIRQRGPDTGVIGPDLRLSPSQAQSYADCPRRYVLERRLGVESDYGTYGTFGRLIHDVLERAERAALEKGRTRATAEEAIDVLDSLFHLYDLGTGQRRLAWRRRGIRLVEHLYSTWPTPEAVPVFLEHPLQLIIDGVEWIGRADRIEVERGIVRIVDYKTTTSVLGVADAAQSLQLGFYLLAARQDPQVVAAGDPREAQLWYPLAKGKSVATRALDVDALHDVEQRLRDIAAGIAAERWDPAIGPGCERCGVRLVCPSFPEGREAYLR